MFPTFVEIVDISKGDKLTNCVYCFQVPPYGKAQLLYISNLWQLPAVDNHSSNLSGQYGVSYIDATPKSNMAELLRLDWKNGRQILNLVWISVEMGKLAYMQLSPKIVYFQPF